MSGDLYDVLHERGLVAQCTDEAIHDRLAEPQSVYIGFDPTADSLHVGSLVPIMGLAWLQRGGHRPIAVVGGATAMIGDPSGKSEARNMLDAETIEHNSAAIREQLGRFLRFDDSANGAVLVNNADWLAERTYVDILREVGPHFSVNRMLTMESVKGRMESGISFLEFNYMV
ncbi:MAG: tyrosine--tRNA ligase, partial [Planctomycetota bacterium]